MKILEYGDKSKEKLILIHGFQSPVTIWKPYIEHYKNNYHVIVPVITGHAPDKKEDFVSFAEEAKAIEEYCLSHSYKDIYAVYGMSMGGVVTAELWQNGRLNIKKVIMDGSPIHNPAVNIISRMQRSFYLDVTHKVQQGDRKTLEQARSISEDSWYDDFIAVLKNMTDKTILNCIDGISEFKLEYSKRCAESGIYYFHGTKFNEILASASAKKLKKLYPHTVVKCFKGKSHCENAMHAPDVMIGELDRVLKL